MDFAKIRVNRIAKDVETIVEGSNTRLRLELMTVRLLELSLMSDWPLDASVSLYLLIKIYKVLHDSVLTIDKFIKDKVWRVFIHHEELLESSSHVGLY